MNKEEQNLNNTEKPKLGISDVSGSCKLVKDKYLWWLIVDNHNIPIKFNHFIDKQIKYLSEIYTKLGYNVEIDENFGDSY